MTPVAGLSGDYEIGVRPADIDHMGHVNNAVYLTWVQEAVVRHWERFADADAVARHLWVALRHEIIYRRPAFLEDGITASVTLEAAAGARARFRTLILRGEDLIAEVISVWCALDAASRRPARVSAETVARFAGAA